MRKTTVGDVMTGSALAVTADARVQDLVESAARHHADCLVVVDREGAALGVVGPAALAKALAAAPGSGLGLGARLPRRLRRLAGVDEPVVAREAMHRPQYTVTQETSVVEAAHVAVRHEAGTLLVVDDERRPVGGVSVIDLMRGLLRPDAELAEQVRHEVFSHGLGVDVHLAGIQVKAVDGVVTLHGGLGCRSMVQDAVRLAEEIDGVSRVVDDLTFVVDDTGAMQAD
ncbi:CBS domain-containing protein [Actinocrinis puniceicyclus]|uniref:CBS domain-containing protein n=1 Tax=Actinocrinis puniceicyclus TaxID=977794 RepID=A0A8J8BGL3_9ACTN|nr:CBS domain-containing protein [Actinocrinis puniceicyclus]MBS2965889.1 CBS domain-containing protein [Actinocrinis puniceicyclus]